MFSTLSQLKQIRLKEFFHIDRARSHNMRRIIINDAETFSRKRNRVSRACQDCRRKKRRCDHASNPSHIRDDTQSRTTRSTPPQGTPRAESANSCQETVVLPPNDVVLPEDQNTRPDYQTQDSSVEACPGPVFHSAEPSLSPPTRFIGDLNPEGIFHRLASAELTTRGLSAQRSIGTWLASKQGVARADTQSSLENYGRGIFYATSSNIQKMLLPILEEEVLATLPPEPNRTQLLAFYRDNVYALLPIIDYKVFQQRRLDRKSYILMSQAAILLASLNPACTMSLRLNGSSELLTPREFGRRLLSAMRLAIEIGTSLDKMILIQVLGAMCLITEGPEGVETSTQLCARMVQLVHSIGLHHQRGIDCDEVRDVTVLSCVWALDRLNAAIHGRPVIMHQQDIGRDLQECFNSQEPTFKNLLNVLVQLDNVIRLYRPRCNPEPKELRVDLPSFEELLTTNGGENLPVKILDTIEVLYNAVTILSCRTEIQTDEQNSVNHPQQDLAALRIQHIIHTEPEENLVFLPFIPYAYSLSLSLAYKRLRHTKIPSHRLRARNDIRSICHLLDRFGQHFQIASVMSDMGKATVAEMDRVAGISSHSIQNGAVTERQGIPAGFEALFGNHSSNTSRTQAQNQAQTSTAAAQDSHVPEILSNADLLGTACDGSDPNAFAFWANTSVDIFSMFDPNFGLQEVDDLFERNLNMSL